MFCYIVTSVKKNSPAVSLYSKRVAFIDENHKVQKYTKQLRFLCSSLFRLTFCNVSTWYHQQFYIQFLVRFAYTLRLYIKGIHSAFNAYVSFCASVKFRIFFNIIFVGYLNFT